MAVFGVRDDTLLQSQFRFNSTPRVEVRHGRTLNSRTDASAANNNDLRFDFYGFSQGSMRLPQQSLRTDAMHHKPRATASNRMGE